MFYVYILKLANQKYYTGQTNNHSRRIKQHKAGQCKSTKNHLPLKVVFTKKKVTRKEARKLEVFIKNRGAHRFLLAHQFCTT
jgi:predicted GIY-YIG superfamily endonuclease